MKEERVGEGAEPQRNGRAHVKADVDDETSHTCSPVRLAEEIGRGTYASLFPSPPPPPPSPFVLSLPFCSISFITVCWLRNRAVVQLLDHEGQH